MCRLPIVRYKNYNYNNYVQWVTVHIGLICIFMAKVSYSIMMLRLKRIHNFITDNDIDNTIYVSRKTMSDKLPGRLHVKIFESALYVSSNMADGDVILSNQWAIQFFIEISGYTIEIYEGM